MLAVLSASSQASADKASSKQVATEKQAAADKTSSKQVATKKQVATDIDCRLLDCGEGQKCCTFGPLPEGRCVPATTSCCFGQFTCPNRGTCVGGEPPSCGPPADDPPPPVCGNNVCEEESGETRGCCPADCGTTLPPISGGSGVGSPTLPVDPCGPDDEDSETGCCGGWRYSRSSEGCCGSFAQRPYNLRLQGCCSGVAYSRASEFCCNGRRYQKPGVCCNGVAYPGSGFCCGGEFHLRGTGVCCGSKLEPPGTVCCNGRPFPPGSECCGRNACAPGVLCFANECRKPSGMTEQCDTLCRRWTFERDENGRVTGRKCVGAIEEVCRMVQNVE